MKSKNLKLLSWNIMGWGRHTCDPSFVSYVSKFDIILLQETWLREKLTLNGFTTSSVDASASQKGGRPSGGLSILISTSIKHVSFSIPPLANLASSSLVRFNDIWLLIINVYLPPIRQKEALKNTWLKLETYITNTLAQHPEVLLILAGDFNARIGPTEADLYDHFHLAQPEIDLGLVLPYRQSKDKGCNWAGLYLTELSHKLNLVIMNGSTEGDDEGEYTFVSNRGSSTIDYFLISYELLFVTPRCKIEHRVESDHLPVTLTLKCVSQADFAEQSAPPEGKLELRPSSIKWSPKVESNLKTILNSEKCLSLRNSMLETESPNDIFEPFQQLSLTIKNLLTRPTCPKALNQNTKNKSWFDQDCINMKQILVENYKMYRQKNLQTIPSEWFELKKKYKKLIKIKKATALKNSWCTLITAANNKDTSTFWKIVTSGWPRTVSMTYSISVNCWEQFYSKLYDQSRYKQNHPPVDIEELPKWLPVSDQEIRSLITRITPGKAPGNDNISSEVYKSNIEWWTPVLASLFTAIDLTTYIPEDWGLAIIVPIYKKGDKNDPGNYRPISLLNIISKMYALHLLDKLQEWLEEEDIIREEQAGFRKNRSAIDHALVLKHLSEKYVASAKGTLFTAFVDFKSAFDLISRDILWKKFETTNIDKRLLILIRKLHENSRVVIRCNSQGNTTRPIPTSNGVRQGCTLAPTLFNFYINSMISTLSEISAHAPTLSNKPLSILVYADDVVLMSITKVGLNRLLRALATYCTNDALKINYNKTKVMVFSRSRLQYKWTLDDHSIEQVSTYKYLGITFHDKGSTKLHQKNAVMNTQRSIKALCSFYYNKGGQYVPAALQVFVIKILAQLLYGSEICTFNSFTTFEAVQTKFLRTILGVPNCVSNPILRLETGMLSVEARVWIRKLNLWLKMFFVPTGLVPLILTDSFLSPWKVTLTLKLLSLGLSPSEITVLGYDKAKSVISQRIKDIDFQTHISQLTLHPVRESSRPGKYAKYFENLNVPKFRRAFMSARFNILPSAVLEGRFKKIPYEHRYCPCGSEEIENINHVLFGCSLYTEIRALYITPIVLQFPGRQEKFYTNFLLADQKEGITQAVAQFFAAAIANRKQFVKQM